MVVIAPKTCESPGCKYAASFGDTTQRTRRFCARHKLEGMLSYQELVRDEGIPASISGYSSLSTFATFIGN